MLAAEGVLRGLIGPREVPRLWDRHLLNCVVIAEEFRDGAHVADIGSGAGLPGVVLAIARPDLRVTLVEPMERRCVWLRHVIDEIGLSNATVVRGRAEALWGELRVDAVTARAVAPLADLATWCLPLVVPGGVVVAMKGSSAQAEVDRDREALRRLGVTDVTVREIGSGLVAEPTHIVTLRAPLRDRAGAGSRKLRRAKRRPLPGD